MQQKGQKTRSTTERNDDLMIEDREYPMAGMTTDQAVSAIHKLMQSKKRK